MTSPFHRTGRFSGVIFALSWGVARLAGAETAAGEPELSISLRGVWAGTIEAGEPFRVAVRVDLPHESAEKLELAPARGSWIEATTVEIISANGQPVPATARPAIASVESVTTLDPDHAASGLWWFPGDTLGTLALGDYGVRARLVIRDGAGWTGEAVSESVSLRVVATSNDPERVTQRCLARANAAILEGVPEKAAELLDAVLETNPDNVPVLGLRAALCLEGGNRAAARVCVDRALALDARSGGEPSVGLHVLADRIEASANESAPAAAVPAWAFPPRSLFNPLPSVAPASSGTQISDPAIQAPPSPAPISSSGGTTPAPGLTFVLPVGGVVSTSELIDATIIADPAGQWAVSATAGTKYGKTQYSPAQATGVPNISIAGNSPDAWCPASKTSGMDWLEATFAKPVHATEVRVRQNDAAGAVAKIEAIEPNGTPHVWWEGVDPYKAPATREIVWFSVRVPQTDYLVAKVKITLNLAAGPGWKEIDAVQLVGTQE